MKTLNEQIYEYLLQENRPVSVAEVIDQEDFKGVPHGCIGRGLLAICGEGLVNYCMKEGKIYFSTDLSVGRGPVGSQNFINKLSRAMSALLGGADGDTPNLFAGSTKVFPENGDAAVDAVLDGLSFGGKFTSEGFEISFPKHPSQGKKDDDEHEFFVTYKDQPIALMTTKMTYLEGDFSEAGMRAIAFGMVMAGLKKIAVCLDAPEEYTGDGLTAFYLPIAPNGFAFVARPDGLHVLRVDWSFEENLPSKRAVCDFFERWLSTYAYLGEKRYSEVLPFDRDELLEKEANKDTEEKLLKEFEQYLDDADNQISAIKAGANEEGTDTPTRAFLRGRKALEKAANIADDLITQATNVINHYKTIKTDRQFMQRLYGLSQYPIHIAADISAEIVVNVSNIPYYSAVDVAACTSTAEKHTIQVFPSKYLDYLELITTQRLNEEKMDQEARENIEGFREAMKARFDDANKAPVYYPDFLFEGKTIVAYLGHDEEVAVPEFVTAIGAYAFKNAKELKRVTLGENVATLRFCPFFGCSRLKTIKVLGDIRSIEGSFVGVGTNKELTVQGYASSSVQQFCEKEGIAFERIEENRSDGLIQLVNDEYDLYQGFALPKIKGYKTTQELNMIERKKLASNRDTAHIRYGMVPVGSAFADYKDAAFSYTVVQEAQNLPGGGLQIAGEIERHFAQPTVHGVYRAVKADRGRVLVRYDTVQEGTDNGVGWAAYVVILARDTKLLISQIFFNGNYSQRQQQRAIDKWAGKILDEKTYNDRHRKRVEAKLDAKKERKAAEKKRREEEAARKRLEAEAEKSRLAAKAWQEAAKQMRVWREETAVIEAKRQEEWDSFAARIDKEIASEIQNFKTERDKELKEADAAVKQAEEHLQKAKNELASLGLFKLGRKKELKAEIESLEAELPRLREASAQIARDYERKIRKSADSAAPSKEYYRKVLEEKYPFPPKPAEASEPQV